MTVCLLAVMVGVALAVRADPVKMGVGTPLAAPTCRADFSLSDGQMKVPAGPGLGVALDWSLAATHPCQPVTHLQHPRLAR